MKRKKQIHSKLHKVVDKNIMYLNGDRWAVREYCKDNKDAKKKFKELKNLNKLKEKYAE